MDLLDLLLLVLWFKCYCAIDLYKFGIWLLLRIAYGLVCVGVGLVVGLTGVFVIVVVYCWLVAVLLGCCLIWLNYVVGWVWIAYLWFVFCLIYCCFVIGRLLDCFLMLLFMSGLVCVIAFCFGWCFVFICLIACVCLLLCVCGLC